MRKRLLVAAIFLPFFVWIIGLNNPVPFYFLIFFGVVTAIIELGGLIENRGIRFNYFITTPTVLLIAIITTFHDSLIEPTGLTISDILWAIVIISMLILGLREVLIGFHKYNFVNISSNLFSIILIGGLGSYVALLHQLPMGSWWIYILFGYNWIYDAAALFAGKYFGKHKLAPNISPAKTVEGLIGGLIMNVLMGLGIYFTLLPKSLGFSLIGFTGLGLLLGLSSQAGDLMESLIKRWSGKKDSSHFIPGHGGILDKIDNLIFSAPILYLVAKMMEKG